MMKMNQMIRLLGAFFLSFGTAFADDYLAKKTLIGPNGGILVTLGDQGHRIELSVEDGALVMIHLLNKENQVIATKASEVVITFFEKDGEKEDYQVGVTDPQKGIFKRKSAHLVKHHILRDQMAFKLVIDGKEVVSKMVYFPLGPNGGQIVGLGQSGLHAELVIDGASVRVHLLDKMKGPATVGAKEIVLTFVERDGEKEDYKVSARTGGGKGNIFERESRHLVKHIKRDKMSIRVNIDGNEHSSKTFQSLYQ